MSSPRRACEDDGSALVMALVFVMVMGLVITALLTQTTTSLKTTQVVRANADKVYAADAGLEQAIEMLRLDATACATPGAGRVLSPIQSNGHTVELSCSNEGTGSSSGANDYAAIVTGTSSSSFTTQGAGSRWIDGPVFAANLGSPDLAVTDGSVFEKQSGSSCSTDADKPGGVTISPSPPFLYHCTVEPVPDPAHVLPTFRPSPIDPVPGWEGTDGDAASCRVFYPGKYTPTRPPVLFYNNYFRSGTYYFENVNLEIDTVVIGGQPAAGESSLVVPNTNCRTAQNKDLGNGTGVKWILGGSSRIILGNDGHLELFARQGGDESVEGQMGISVQAALGGAFIPSTVDLSTSLIHLGSAANQEIVIHGLVHAPNSYVDAFPTNESQANFQGGLVVNKLNLRSSPTSAAPIIATTNAPRTRDLLVTAVARGQDGSVDVTATAVVSIDNNEARTFKVSSWRIE